MKYLIFIFSALLGSQVMPSAERYFEWTDKNLMEQLEDPSSHLNWLLKQNEERLTFLLDPQDANLVLVVQQNRLNEMEEESYRKKNK
ncbi:hypothetical protein KBB68_03735 [Candidatus Babeliales bacterium]|nr:hypothetical protein [Candidatus Babeliales bacterium]